MCDQTYGLESRTTFSLDMDDTDVLIATHDIAEVRAERRFRRQEEGSARGGPRRHSVL